MTVETHVAEVPDVDNVASRLHLARWRRGMEIQELSARTGISRSTIANYEDPEWPRRRSRAFIRLWAIATGVPATWLETGKAPDPEGGPGASGVAGGGFEPPTSGLHGARDHSRLRLAA